MSIDFLIGITLFLLTFLFVAQLVPTLFTPFNTESEVSTLLADRVSTSLVERYLVDDPTKPSILNLSRVDAFFNQVDKWASDSDRTTWKEKLGLVGAGGSYDFNVSYSYGNGSVRYGGNSTPTIGNVGRTIRVVTGGNSTKLISQSGNNNFCLSNNCGDLASWANAGQRNWTLLQNVTAGCLTGWIRLQSNWTNYLADKGGSNKTCKDASMTSTGSPWTNTVGGFRLAKNTAPYEVLWQVDLEEHVSGRLDIDSCDVNVATYEASSATAHKHDAGTKWGYIQSDNTIYVNDLFTRSDLLLTKATDELAAYPTVTYNLTVVNGHRLYGTYEFSSCPDTPRLVVQVW